MARAELTTKAGTKVIVEGTPDEVANVVGRLNGGETRSVVKSGRRADRPRARSGSPTSLISGMIHDGFFKKPKELALIKTALEEQGHFYAVTTLSPTLLRLVRKRELRRIKEGKRWLYVN